MVKSAFFFLAWTSVIEMFPSVLMAVLGRRQDCELDFAEAGAGELTRDGGGPRWGAREPLSGGGDSQSLCVTSCDPRVAEGTGPLDTQHGICVLASVTLRPLPDSSHSFPLTPRTESETVEQRACRRLRAP